jgi:hypothetical protein
MECFNFIAYINDDDNYYAYILLQLHVKKSYFSFRTHKLRKLINKKSKMFYRKKKREIKLLLNK